MQIVRCTSCRMMYQNPRIAETDLADAYEVLDGYMRFPEQDASKREVFLARIQRFQLERQLPSDGAFLDVGASRGVMLDCVREKLPRWRISAIELSASARQRIRERGFEAVASLDELHRDEKFDWINIDNVLEHIPEPVDILESLKSRLKPGGFIYIDVPNESLFQFRYRVNDLVRGFSKLPTAEGHINLFTPRTLSRAFDAAGLKPEKFWLESVSLPHRLKGSLGGNETPRVRQVLRLLRATQLDVVLRIAYFICARVEALPTSNR
jgi:SAM-dependent methyltransferase